MNLLCKLGFHKADKTTYLQVKKQRGNHKWHRNYAVCKRCGKRLHLISNKKE